MGHGMVFSPWAQNLLRPLSGIELCSCMVLPQVAMPVCPVGCPRFGCGVFGVWGEDGGYEEGASQPALVERGSDLWSRSARE